MFKAAEWVFKNGECVVQNGTVLKRRSGSAQIIQPQFERRIESDLQQHFDRFYNLKLDQFTITEADMALTGEQRFQTHDLAQPYSAASAQGAE